MNDKKRCAWVTQDQIYIDYHDKEWGRPCHDDQRMFEFLILEGAEAGLSWITILKKREHYRTAFDNFSPQKIAGYNQKKINALLMNPGIVRNRMKIESVIKNAKAYLEMQNRGISFSEWLWQFVHNKPIQNNWKSARQIPTSTPVSDTLSKELKKKGFKFIGTTICYAYMQAMGMVNDHTIDCFCHSNTDENYIK